MLGMNVGLDVRVIDQIGLANPLAQHTERLKHGRIGHDKNLFPDWVVADGPWVKVYPGIPGYLDQQWVAEAVAALKCPETQAVLNSVRAPMTLHRFVSNIVNSLRVHQVPDRPCSALRTRQVWARRCPTRVRRPSRGEPTVRAASREFIWQISTTGRHGDPSHARTLTAKSHVRAYQRATTGGHMRKRRFGGRV